MVLSDRKSSSTFMQGGRRYSEFRDDDVPSQLYDETPSRLSAASMFDNNNSSTTSNNQRQREKFPWKTTLVAFLLFIIGLIFLFLAIFHFSKHDNETELAFIVLGCIAFLPGCYAIFNIVQWYRGIPGFHRSDFAHWDEEE